MDAKCCRTCQVEKPLYQFRKWRNVCKSCDGKSKYHRRKARGYHLSNTYKNNHKRYVQSWRLHYPERDILYRLRNRAKAANIPFNLTKEDIVIPEFCPVLGIKLSHHADAPSPSSPSVDRVIPKLGYIKGNIKIISMRANRLKSDMSLEELEKIVAYIRSHIVLTTVNN